VRGSVFITFVSLKAISSVGLGTYYSLRGHRLLMETGTEQHFLLAAKYFGPFQNSAMVMLMAQVFYHDGYKIGVSSGFCMLQANFRNTRDLEEIAHCAVSVQFADSVCK
jgi:hypothetical protein